MDRRDRERLERVERYLVRLLELHGIDRERLDEDAAFASSLQAAKESDQRSFRTISAKRWSR